MDTFFSVKRFNTNEFLELFWEFYSMFTLVTLNTILLFSLFGDTVNLSVLSYLNELTKIVIVRIMVSVVSVIINLPANIEEHNNVLWKIYNEQKRQSKRLKRSFRSD